jgi:hypothetical protein
VKRVAEADGQTEVATTTIQRQWFFALSSSRWRRGSRFFASLAASRSFRNGQLRLPIELQLGAKRSRRDHCWDTHCNSGKRDSQSFDHVQPPSIASSSTTDRELETVFPITTARLLQAYFAAKILVSWLVAIIGPAFRSLWRESGAAQLPPSEPAQHHRTESRLVAELRLFQRDERRGLRVDKEKLFIAKPDEVVPGANCVIVFETIL